MLQLVVEHACGTTPLALHLAHPRRLAEPLFSNVLVIVAGSLNGYQLLSSKVEMQHGMALPYRTVYITPLGRCFMVDNSQSE